MAGIIRLSVKGTPWKLYPSSHYNIAYSEQQSASIVPPLCCPSGVSLGYNGFGLFFSTTTSNSPADFASSVACAPISNLSSNKGAPLAVAFTLLRKMRLSSWF